VGQFPWRSSSLTAERLEQDLSALDGELAGASDPLSARTREWIAVARVEGPRLLALQAAWSAPGASADELAAELRPLFARLVAASQAVHDAVARELQRPPPGTLASLAYACRVSPLLARLPVRGLALEAPILEAGGGAAPSPAMPEPPAAELRALATACLDEARAYLAANAGAELDYNETYEIGLATSLTNSVLQEEERRRAPNDRRAFVSTAGNMAQSSSYLATTRRRRDPLLRPAEAALPK
jgi:hypothetical protein